MAERRIEATVEIEASPSQVWSLLTNFAGTAAWNPFIMSISGTLVPGGKLTVDIVPPGKNRMRFRPTIVVVEPERELRWLGRFLLPGVMDGEHYFFLEPVGLRRTRLTQGENFSGLLVGLFGGTLSATKAGFEAINVALKRRAETREPVGESSRGEPA